MEALMKSHGAKLARYFNFKLRDEDLSQDLLIETFLRAWKSRHTFRGEAKASTWLWTIGQRTMAHYFKQRKRRENEVLTEKIPEQMVDGRQTVVEKSAKQQALIECLSQLNEHIQRSAELVWLLGHSFVEAAEILEESADTVRMRLKRARRPLQDCLSDKGVVASSR